MDEKRIWTDELCARLNDQQQRRDLHPYTCGNDSRHPVLVATPAGWVCSACDYRQGWVNPPPAPGV